MFIATFHAANQAPLGAACRPTTPLPEPSMPLQKELEKIIKTVEKHGYSVSVTGDQKIRYIKKNGEDSSKNT